MEELIQIGAVTGTHGVRGEVKAFPTTDDPARYKELKKVIVTSKKGQEILEIAGVKFFKQMVILNFGELMIWTPRRRIKAQNYMWREDRPSHWKRMNIIMRI